MGFRSSFAFIGYFCGFCGVHNSIFLNIFLVDVINTRGPMKLVNSKECVVLRTWRRVEVGPNDMVNDISETFSALGLVV